MAKSIKETPILIGDDATRFERAAQNVVPASAQEVIEAKRPIVFRVYS